MIVVSTKLSICLEESLFAVMTSVGTCTTAVIAVIALCYTMREYELHKKSEKAKILSEYNQRYCSDENIIRVVKRLMADEDSEENVDITYEKEMFLRFFEELEYAIEQQQLSKEVVYDLFSYYAIDASERGIFFLEDIKSESWERFHKFVNDMREIREKRKKEKNGS